MIKVKRNHYELVKVVNNKIDFSKSLTIEVVNFFELKGIVNLCVTGGDLGELTVGDVFTLYRVESEDNEGSYTELLELQSIDTQGGDYDLFFKRLGIDSLLSTSEMR